MKRREFIALVSGAASVWPLVAHAQQAAMPVIGFLNTRAPHEDPQLLAAFRHGLTDTGYVEGRNVTIEYRWAEGHNDRLSTLAADLVRRNVTVIAANSQATVAAKAATTTIPIVFVTGVDPVEVGFVVSLNRPGGNLTGVTSMDTELGQKRVELLHELLPKATIIAALFNPTFPGSDGQARVVLDAASALGWKLHVLHASIDADIDMAFAKMTELQVRGLVIGNDPFLASRSALLARLTIRDALPTVSPYRAFATAGGLISYATSLTDLYRLTGVFTGRILKGAKPADLPVELPTKFELAINLKTAKALGLAIPPSLLQRADQVIE